MSRYHIEVAAGCFSGAVAPVIASHDSWDSAVRAALKSDRVAVVCGETGTTLFQIPRQNDRRLGAGRYGNGMTVAQAHKRGLI